jgi:hypothetical protein
MDNIDYLRGRYDELNLNHQHIMWLMESPFHAGGKGAFIGAGSVVNYGAQTDKTILSLAIGSAGLMFVLLTVAMGFGSVLTLVGATVSTAGFSYSLFNFISNHRKGIDNASLSWPSFKLKKRSN